ncbi:hypothetical protein HDZ31DRAFT_48662 [Schizophyllum fasciatum]
MNGAASSAPPPRVTKPVSGPAPPAPAAAPPNPPVANGHAPPPRSGANVNGNHAHPHPQPHPATQTANKGKKKNEPPVDPATMYESLKNRIAALEEEEVLEEEEERRFAEEAQKSVKGMEENAIHAKYIELFAEFKRMERDHAKEKQKLVKDKDAAKGQLSKANQTKTKMENLARELQKDNKRLREDGKRLAQSVEDAQEELMQMKSTLTKRNERVQAQQDKYNDQPDIVVKVVCRYRAELFFKISRKTKLSRLFGAWTDRMEKVTSGVPTIPKAPAKEPFSGSNAGKQADKADPRQERSEVHFVFTHAGRQLQANQSPEDAGMEDGDEIVAVEMMDLTENITADDGAESVSEPSILHRQLLRKNWSTDPQEARRTLEDIFDSVVRERLKEVLKQYELRERHFECVMRSKELEVLLSRARASEQKQLLDAEKATWARVEEENALLRKELEDAQNGQTVLIDKLIQCCQEVVRKPNSERTQRLFASLRDELEKKRPKALRKASVDSSTGG